MPFGQKPTQFLHKCVEIVKNAYTSVKLIPPAGFEQLQQHTGLTHIYKQGGTVVEDSRLVRMLQAITSLTDDEKEVLVELLRRMG